MPDVSDMELLQDYARHGSEAAFAELVQRHVNLVYSAALRQVGIAAHAEEITQAVFVILARKAARLRPDTVLEAWFYQTTRLTSLSFLRGERRRQWREQEAFMQTALQESGEPLIWNQLAPLLDEAMSRLGKKDREAVVLRYFKGKSLNEVAAALKTTEAAAQSRVHRALEKLRKYFLQRGIDSTTAAITGAISANSIQAAPVALAKSITAVASAKGATASTSALPLIKGALKIMAWTKMKTAAVTVATIILATGTTTLVVKTVHAVWAASPPDIQGSWEGVAAIFGAPGMSPGEKARSRVVFQFLKTNGVYAATGVFIDTAPDPFQVANFTYDSPSVRFAAGQNFTFEGKLRAGATEISGTQRRGNLSAPMVLKRANVPDAAPEPLAKSDYTLRAGSDLQGTWNATLGDPIHGTLVAIKIAEPSPGNFHAELDNLTSSWVGQPLTVTYNPPEVKLQVASGAGMFQGELRNGNTEIVGDWIQGGKQAPVVFKRADR